ncbi:MAG: DUF4190 domain-containing protein [Phycisphaerae bacterium]|jgi:hypothetical protein|nr:DUF4190 domain-containing protein [Phycisphaerae bacterium]
MNTNQTDTFEQTEVQHYDNTQRSKLAIASLICSLIFCCPVVTIFGPILGIVALLKIKSSHLLGKKLAIAGIFLGVITTVLSCWGGYYVYSKAKGILGDVTQTASEVITASYSHDFEEVRKNFSSQNSAVSDEEIDEFANLLLSRYGSFDSVVVDWEADDQDLQPSGQITPMPVILVFETESVHGTLMFEIVPGGDFVEAKFCCIKIDDTTHGDIIFPKDSQCDQ